MPADRSPDEELRRLLEQAHRQDRVPMFSSMWAEAQANAGGPSTRRLPWSFALAGGILAAAAVALWLLPAGAPPSGLDAGPGTMATATIRFTVPEDVTALSGWSGPTDFLLSDVQDNIISSTPKVGDPESALIRGLGQLNLQQLNNNRR